MFSIQCVANEWRKVCSDNFLFCVKSLSKKYRGLFVSKLGKELPDLPQSLYDKLFQKKWVVYAKPPFGSPENVIAYLSRYTHKIAISNYRILAIDTLNKKVPFSMKDYRKHGQKTTVSLTSKDFIKRFQNHILPKGFTRIRHYGFLSSSWKKEKLPQLQLQLLDREQDVLEIYIKTENTLLNSCPSCRKGELITLINFDGREPPKNYRQILKYKLQKYNS